MGRFSELNHESKNALNSVSAITFSPNSRALIDRRDNTSP
jgi:hypothetical protein